MLLLLLLLMLLIAPPPLLLARALSSGRRQCWSVLAKHTHTACMDMTWKPPMRSVLICRTRSAPHADADDDGWSVHAAAQDAAGRTQPALQQSACCGVQAARPHA